MRAFAASDSTSFQGGAKEMFPDSPVANPRRDLRFKRERGWPFVLRGDKVVAGKFDWLNDLICQEAT
jgi:hypothetical protein